VTPIDVLGLVDVRYSDALVARRDSTWTKALSHSEEKLEPNQKLFTHRPPELKAKRHPQLAYFGPIIKFPGSPYSSFSFRPFMCAFQGFFPFF
jgi:hypothetical protein